MEWTKDEVIKKMEELRDKGFISVPEGNPLCGDCMVTNEKGDICPTCGRKVPHELMNSGFCIDCFRNQD